MRAAYGGSDPAPVPPSPRSSGDRDPKDKRPPIPRADRDAGAAAAPLPWASGPSSWCRRKARRPSSTFHVENADQSEKPPRGIKVKFGFVFQLFLQKHTAFVMQGTAAHIQRLNLLRRCGTDRLVIGLADQKIILDDFAKGRK